MKKLDKTNLGQVFTPIEIANKMVSLIKNNGNKLEPSCGDGVFINLLNNITGIEYDSTHCPNGAINIDFFSYDINNKFDTVIGNPPYVKYNNINSETKMLLENYNELFDKRSNLYLFFIYKSILHLKENGELIFIIPRDFLKSTSSKRLNQFIYENGTITDFIDFGDKNIFKNATPNTIIVRFEKNNYSRLTNKNLKFTCQNGKIYFMKNNYSIKFSDLFYVKVGAVSGNDKIFEHPEGIDFVCSKTNKTGQTRKMLYNKYHIDLEKYKNILIKRKIKKFDNSNWYMWGRNFYQSNEPRIYVNIKTRNKKPFFLSDCICYDGSILAIFPKSSKIGKEIKKACHLLNEIDWNELGFICGNRFMFSQNSLENCLLPDSFKDFLS